MSGQLVTCQLAPPLSPVSVAQSNASERSIVVTATRLTCQLVACSLSLMVEQSIAKAFDHPPFTCHDISENESQDIFPLLFLSQLVQMGDEWGIFGSGGYGLESVQKGLRREIRLSGCGFFWLEVALNCILLWGVSRQRRFVAANSWKNNIHNYPNVKMTMRADYFDVRNTDFSIRSHCWKNRIGVR